MSLITVDSFMDTQLTELARMLLESEGIPAHLHSINHASLLPGIFGAGSIILGGIRLQVPKSCVEKARVVLKQFHADLGDE